MKIEGQHPGMRPESHPHKQAVEPAETDATEGSDVIEFNGAKGHAVRDAVAAAREAAREAGEKIGPAVSEAARLANGSLQPEPIEETEEVPEVPVETEPLGDVTDPAELPLVEDPAIEVPIEPETNYLGELLINHEPIDFTV